MATILASVVTCPACGFAGEEAMPTDACQYFYECRGCGALLRPKPGHCCVFCSYGSVPCPPMQSCPTRSACECGRENADPDANSAARAR